MNTNENCRVCGSDYYVPNINRAKNELALDVWIDLDRAIKRLIDSATRHGQKSN